MKFDEEIRLPRPSHDAWLVVIASGPGTREPYWPTPRPNVPRRADWEPRVIGSTNPIWLDGDGDGRFLSPNAYARQLISAHGHDPSVLIRNLGNFDSATAVQAASLLTNNGVDLNATAWRRALGGSEPHVRHGISVYLNLLRP